MAQGDEGARGARVERGAVRTGRCAAGLALLWFWVPWAAAIAHPLEQGALLTPLLATALFFGACACAALAALRLAKRVGTGYARMGDVLAASAGSLGSVIALLAYAAGEASLALQVLAMLLSGFAMGLAIVRWERSGRRVRAGDGGVRRRSAGIVVGAVVRPVRGRWFGGEPGGTRRRGLACRAPSCIAARCAGCGGHPAAHVANGLVSEALRGSVRGVGGGDHVRAHPIRLRAVRGRVRRYVSGAAAGCSRVSARPAVRVAAQERAELHAGVPLVRKAVSLVPVNPGTPISLNVSVAFCLLWIGSSWVVLVMGSVNRWPGAILVAFGRAAFCSGGRSCGRARGDWWIDDA